MSADSFFFKGYSHDVCQDYSMAQDNLIIVSDGCSASPDTDFGARLLSKIAANILNSTGVNLKTTTFTDMVVTKIKETSSFLNLHDNIFDATLLFSTPEVQYCYGDGVIAYVTDSEIIIYDICYPSGAPLYLNYSTNIERKESFINEFGVKRDVLISVLDKQTGNLKQETEVSDNNVSPYIISGIHANVIVLMSDGINTFDQIIHNETSRFQVSLDTNVIIHKLLSFKSLHGQFVKRRTKSFIKECKDLDWENFDDVSIAALSVGK